MTKSIVVLALQNVDKIEDFLRGMGMRVVTGSRYFGVFVSDREEEDR